MDRESGPLERCQIPSSVRPTRIDASAATVRPPGTAAPSSVPSLAWIGPGTPSVAAPDPIRTQARSQGEREAHCPSAVRGATSDHTIGIATQQAEIRPGRRVDGRAPPFAKLATFNYRDRPRGIPGGFPLHSNARASVRCVGSFQRWAKLILANLDPCFLPRQLATRDRQIHLWRHGVGTETLCGSPSLPPSPLPGRLEGGWTEYRSKCLRRSPSPEKRTKKRERERGSREGSNFIVFAPSLTRLFVPSTSTSAPTDRGTDPVGI